MQVLASRVLVHPTDFERSFRFYAENLGLHVYREWGRGCTRGVVFFLGGGLLELSGSSRTEASESVSLWLQARDADTRPGRVDYRDRRGIRDPPAPTSLSLRPSMFLSPPNLVWAIRVKMHRCASRSSYELAENPRAWHASPPTTRSEGGTSLARATAGGDGASNRPTSGSGRSRSQVRRRPSS
jgi:hypothetical protein